jgi:hypothetical protein
VESDHCGEVSLAPEVVLQRSAKPAGEGEDFAVYKIVLLGFEHEHQPVCVTNSDWFSTGCINHFPTLLGQI